MGLCPEDLQESQPVTSDPLPSTRMRQKSSTPCHKYVKVYINVSGFITNADSRSGLARGSESKHHSCAGDALLSCQLGWNHWL